MKNYTLVLFIWLLFSSQSFASFNDMDEDYLNILSVSANCRVLEKLPSTCAYVTTDMYAAAAACRMYNRGEALSIYNVHRKIDLKKNEQFLDSKNEAQARTLVRLRENLWELIKTSKGKREMQIASKNGLRLAQNMALRSIEKKNSYFYSCKAKLLAGAGGGGCGSAMRSTLTLLEERQRLDETPNPSIIADNKNKQLDHTMYWGLRTPCTSSRKVYKRAKSALLTCNSFRKWFWLTTSYCDKNRLMNSVLSYSDPKNYLMDILFPKAYAQTFVGSNGQITIQDEKMKNDFEKLKREVVNFTDDWVATATGRYRYYAKMIIETQIAIEWTGRMIRDLEKELQWVEKQIILMQGQLEKLGDDKFKYSLPDAKLANKASCLDAACRSFEDIFKNRRDDFGALMSKDHLDAALSLGVATDSINRGKLDDKAIANIKNLNRKGELLKNYSDGVEKRLNKLHKGKTPSQINLKKIGEQLSKEHVARASKVISTHPKKLLNYIVRKDYEGSSGKIKLASFNIPAEDRAIENLASKDKVKEGYLKAKGTSQKAQSTTDKNHKNNKETAKIENSENLKKSEKKAEERVIASEEIRAINQVNYDYGDKEGFIPNEEVSLFKVISRVYHKKYFQRARIQAN